MMTRREAHQRAAVHNCGIVVHRGRNGECKFVAVHETWTRQEIRDLGVQRDDIEDAVLDCGRINKGLRA